MKFSIKLLYLYLFSFIGLLITIIGTVQLVDLGIKVYVFKGADKYEYAFPAKIMSPDGKEVKQSNEEIAEEKRRQEAETQKNRQRQTSTAVSMILVGFPLYLYHWKKLKD